MRILYLTARGDVVGGQGIHVRDMTSRLIADGHEAHILVGEGTDVPELFDARQAPYTQIPGLWRDPHPVRDSLAFVRILRFMRRYRPDILSTHTSKAGALGRPAAKLLGIPSVYTPHCWSFVDHFPRAGFYRRVEKALAPLTARFVAVSEFERQLGLKAGVCTETNCWTIHNGMMPMDDVVAEPELSPPELVSIARFDDQKDHKTLIEALSDLKDLEWKLKLVGLGSLRPQVEQQIADAGLTERVEIISYSNQIHALLKAAQVYVLATHWESFPRSILEAMRAGLPVIASDVGGCAESVADGSNGYIVPPRDVPLLRERLRALIADPDLRKRMGGESYHRFINEFTFEHMYQKHLKLYEDILGRSATRAGADRPI